MSLRLFLVLAFVSVAALAVDEERCTYNYSVWNVKKKRSVKTVKVKKPKTDLTDDEKDASGCTPCSEDQIDVKLSSGQKFRLCAKVAEKMKGAMEAAIQRGQKITTVVGYRAQMSRGAVDADGNRTGLSNHAFGVAVDVNENSNGLYEKCFKWNPKKCKLRKAGKYSPGEDELSLSKESPLYEEMAKAGFKWGGEIAGQQKDFMHFSPSGY